LISIFVVAQRYSNIACNVFLMVMVGMIWIVVKLIWKGKMGIIKYMMESGGVRGDENRMNYGLLWSSFLRERKGSGVVWLLYFEFLFGW
jgi:hypothetical protein